MSVQKPIRVKNVSSEVIFYGNARRRPGVVFYIATPEHFSVRTMAMVDEDTGREIRHLGGFNSQGKSLKGVPVAPGEDISLPTDEEKRNADADAEYERRLAELRRDRELAKAPKAEVMPEATETPSDPEPLSENVI